MSVEAEHLDEWIGAEVVAANGDKLGKVTDVYYKGPEALAVEFSSGLIGKKYRLAGLSGATVSTKHLRLGVSDTIATDGGLDAQGLQLMANGDDRLQGLSVDDLESGSAREERLAAAARAAQEADRLEAEATAQTEEAKRAAATADESMKASASAEQARVEAVQKAETARQRAYELGA
jgi:hypothetical protein